MLSKKCLVCDKEFFKPINESQKNWDERRKFCSRNCHNLSLIGKPNTSKTKFKKGQTSFNKGKKLPKTSREKHGMWKGGRTQKDVGYILIKLADHPFCDSQGYIREHRLVMEKHLGRYLDPKEVVHHINRKKDDNQLENLILFSSNAEHLNYHRQNY